MNKDWKALAAAQGIELAPPSVARLDALAKTLAGLRGMLDWAEEPAEVFECEPEEAQ